MTIQTAALIALLAIAPATLFGQKPYSDKPEEQSLQQAIAFEKYKESAAEDQARKDAADQKQGASKTAPRSKNAKSEAKAEKAKPGAGQETSQGEAKKK